VFESHVSNVYSRYQRFNVLTSCGIARVLGTHKATVIYGQSVRQLRQPKAKDSCVASVLVLGAHLTGYSAKLTLTIAVHAVATNFRIYNSCILSSLLYATET